MIPVAVVAAALAVIAVASHVVPPRYGRDSPPSYTPPSPVSTPSRVIKAPPRGSSGQTHPFDLTVPAYILLAIVLAGLLWALAILVWRRVRAGLQARSRRAGESPDALGTAAASLARELETAVDDGFAELLDGPVADAIVACWLRLEQAAVAAGVALDRSDTPTETAVRVLADTGVRAAPVRELAELYREARFSQHVMGDVDRERARAALADVRDELRRVTGPRRHDHA